MASSKLPWSHLWATLWSLIPSPATKGRLLLALDDTINPKTGKKIFGCASFFDHAAKINQSKYPWSQNIISIGLSVIWIYAGYLDKTPQHCYAVNNRSHFAFSDGRKLITQAALNKDFVSFCPGPGKPKQNSFIDALLQMVA